MTVLHFRKKLKRLHQEWTPGEIEMAKELRDHGLSAAQIAVRIRRSAKSVASKLYALDEAGGHMKTRNPEPPPSETNIVNQAEIVLRKRLYWRAGLRFLDGSPCDLDRLMLEANRALVSHCMPQLGKNPKWLVHP